MESYDSNAAQLSNQITDHIFWLPFSHNQGTANTKGWPELGLMSSLVVHRGAQAPLCPFCEEHSQPVEADRQDLTSPLFLGTTERGLQATEAEFALNTFLPARKP